MKKIFPGYCKKTEKEITEIWRDGIILFDANVLLNLYRYSEQTKETIIELIKKFKKRTWLPHQSALEYNRNRYEVIAQQEKAYKEFSKRIEEIQKDLQSKNKPPFLPESVHKELNKVFDKVNLEVQKSITKYNNYFEKDPIYEELSSLFKSKISKAYDKKRLAEIYKEGKDRYEIKHPPGYQDEKNKKDINKYGDLILWFQIIDITKNEKKPAILITDERKNDWWWKINDGRIMGPRYELVEEIKKVAQVSFHMYSSESFLSFGQKFLKEEVDSKALEEIQTIRNTYSNDNLHIQELSNIIYDLQNIDNTIDNSEGLILLNKIQSISKRINSINDEIKKKKLNEQNVDEIDEYTYTLKITKIQLEQEIIELRKKLKNYLIKNLNNTKLINYSINQKDILNHLINTFDISKSIS
jgi:hypothetical protein